MSVWWLQSETADPLGNNRRDPFGDGIEMKPTNTVPAVGDVLCVQQKVDGEWLAIGMKVTRREFLLAELGREMHEADRDAYVTVFVEVTKVETLESRT